MGPGEILPIGGARGRLKGRRRRDFFQLFPTGFLLTSVPASRDITLLTKVCIAKAMVFSVAMYGCESWTIKSTERRRTDAFKLWCWRRLLQVPWTARRSNQSVLKEISPEYSLEELILKLTLQYFGHLRQRSDSLEKILMLERLKVIEGGSREEDG